MSVWPKPKLNKEQSSNIFHRFFAFLSRADQEQVLSSVAPVRKGASLGYDGDLLLLRSIWPQFVLRNHCGDTVATGKKDGYL
jgi:hypothetical protein